MPTPSKKIIYENSIICRLIPIIGAFRMTQIIQMLKCYVINESHITGRNEPHDDRDEDEEGMGIGCVPHAHLHARICSHLVCC